MKKNNKKGFTLVELVIVVAVMAVLVAIAIPTVSSITGSAKKAVAASNAQTIESMIKLAEAEAAKDDDGTATLDEPAVAKAIVNAKLGIDDGVFFYNTKSGSVVASGESNPTVGEDVFSITFSESDKTVAVKGSGTATTYKLDGSDLPSTPATPSN